MKTSDIIKQVNRDFDDDYDNGDIIDWINRCLDDLTPVAKKEAYQEYPIVSSNSYAIPADYHKTACILIEDNEYDELPIRDKVNAGYKIWNGALSLQFGPDSGTIEFYYYRKLKHVASPDDVPEIDDSYHDLFILYALGNLQYMEEDYDGRPDALNKYEARKAAYKEYIDSRHASIDSIVVI